MDHPAIVDIPDIPGVFLLRVPGLSASIPSTQINSPRRDVLKFMNDRRRYANALCDLDHVAVVGQVDRLAASATFKAELKKTLYKMGAFAHPFEGLNMCKATSPDGRFRIFNWNVPLSKGKEHYEALVLIPKGKSVRKSQKKGFLHE